MDRPRDVITVRPATVDDADEVARVHTASSDSAYRGIAPPDPGGLERRRAMWRDILGAPSRSTFVAVVGTEIVGLLNVGPALDGSAVGEVRTIYVLEAWWGSGAGQALMDQAHRELARDFDVAELTVLAANPRARRFYERNGWELRELLVEPHFGGVPVEVARYRRRFDRQA